MTTTTTTKPTADDLRAQIAAAEQTIADAQVAIGKAAVDGGSVAGHVKRQQAARDRIATAKAALDELHRRETDEAYRQQLADASARRLGAYEWIVERCRRVESFLAARDALAAAEQHLIAQGRHPVLHIASGLRGDPVTSDLDVDVIEAIPYTAYIKNATKLHDRIELEAVRRVRELAEQRAAEEAAGEAQDFTGVESTATLLHRERRARLKAERAAREQREQEERLRQQNESELASPPNEEIAAW